MKAIKSNILCKELSGDSAVTKVGNLVIPEEEKEYMKVSVVSVGEEVNNVSPGDNIYIYPKCGRRLNINGENYRVINVSEVILVL